MTTAELYRLLCNLICIGTVTQIKDNQARVSAGGNETNWIHWRADRAGDAVSWHPPSVGEQVIILSPDGELDNAMIIGSLYSSAYPAPSDSKQAGVIAWPDGATFSYEPQTGTLEITGVKAISIKASAGITVQCDTATVKANTSVTLDTPDVTCTQKLTAAELSITKGGELNGDFTGTMTINGVKPYDHSHGGVKSGDSRTEGTE